MRPLKIRHLLLLTAALALPGVASAQCPNAGTGGTAAQGLAGGGGLGGANIGAMLQAAQNMAQLQQQMRIAQQMRVSQPSSPMMQQQLPAFSGYGQANASKTTSRASRTSGRNNNALAERRARSRELRERRFRAARESRSLGFGQ